MFERKQFKKTVLGFFRALEVTHNPETGEYHPHFHALLCVTPSYFTRDYIKQSEWVQLWQEAARLDYKPMVNVQAVKGRRDPEKEAAMLKEMGIEITADGIEEHEFLPGKAVAEVAKYTVKSGDYIFPDDEERTDDVVLTLDKALKQRKLYAFGGVMKDAWTFLEQQDKVTDPEESDLIHVDEDDGCKCSVCNSDMLEELYKWVPDQGQYIRSEQN